MNAIFKKELRDCLRWTPLGMVFGLVMLWMIRPSSVYEAVQMETKLISLLGLTAGMVAIGLGLLQSLFDTRNDSRGYLLHRPTSTREIYWGKVAAGYVAFAITLAVPIAVAMTYLQVKGVERLPTNARQITPFLLSSFIVFLLHPTVLWIVNRDAKWVGTRLLPAVGAVTLTMFLMLLLSNLPFQNVFGSMAFMLAIFAAFATVTLLASRHAFAHQSQLPPRSSHHWQSTTSMIGLIFSGVVLYGVVLAFLVESIPKTPRDYTTYRLSMNAEGEWQQLAITRRGGNWNQEEILVRDLDDRSAFAKVNEGWREAHGSQLSPTNYNRDSPLRQFQYLGSSTSKTVPFGEVSIVGHQNRVLLYDRVNTLVAIVSPEGGYATVADAQGEFEGIDALSNLHNSSIYGLNTSVNPLLADDNGVYQLLADELRAQKLLDGKVDYAMLLLEEDDRPASLWTMADNQLTWHTIEPTDTSSEMPQADSATIKTTHQFALPPIKVVSSRTFQVDPPNAKEMLRVIRTPDGEHALIHENYSSEVSKYAKLDANGGVESLGSVQLPKMQTGHSEDWIGWFFPPAILTLMITTMSLFYGVAGPGSPMGIVFSTIGHAAFASLAVWYMGGRVGLSNRARITWTALGATLGFGVVIALISIYRKPIKEDCPRCTQARRIDLATCEHCGQPWDPPAEEGVEIFERDSKRGNLRTASIG
ncbi:hypothetical protein N9N28_15870 [Rubripirellula amarantea]|nr:hypothetical protein [Rubripirellula amarantea]